MQINIKKFISAIYTLKDKIEKKSNKRIITIKNLKDSIYHKNLFLNIENDEIHFLSAEERDTFIFENAEIIFLNKKHTGIVKKIKKDGKKIRVETFSNEKKYYSPEKVQVKFKKNINIDEFLKFF